MEARTIHVQCLAQHLYAWVDMGEGGARRTWTWKIFISPTGFFSPLIGSKYDTSSLCYYSYGM